MTKISSISFKVLKNKLLFNNKNGKTQNEKVSQGFVAAFLKYLKYKETQNFDKLSDSEKEHVEFFIWYEKIQNFQCQADENKKDVMFNFYKYLNKYNKEYIRISNDDISIIDDDLFVKFAYDIIWQKHIDSLITLDFNQIDISKRVKDKSKFLYHDKDRWKFGAGEEDAICKAYVNKYYHNEFHNLTFKDVQVPLKEAKTDYGYGKIDLVGYDSSDKSLLVFEVKKEDSPETLFRAVCEIITYYHQLAFGPDRNFNYENRYITDFIKLHLKNERESILKVVPCILLNKEAYIIGYEKAYELIEKYGIRCFTFTNKFIQTISLTNKNIDLHEIEEIEDISKYKSISKIYKNKLIENENIKEEYLSGFKEMFELEKYKCYKFE